MKAIVYEKYGPPEVLKMTEIAKPVPKKDEVLIKVMATSVSAGDWRMRKANPPLARIAAGLFRPTRIKILGFELSGVVEDTGSDVTKFEIGDKVFAFLGFKFGGYVQYKCMKETAYIAPMPQGLRYEEAAVVPTSGITALSFIRDNAKVNAGQNVMIYGASGSVGTYAVQLAKYYGARVTAVCSTANVKMVGSLGADAVVDYKKQDFAATEERYDLVFDAVNKVSKKKAAPILKRGGRYISVHDSTSKISPAHLSDLRELIIAKKLKPVVDRVYNMDEIVAAHRYVEAGHKKGNVAVSIDHES